MCTCIYRCLGRTRYISLVLFAIGITNRYIGWAADSVLFFLLGTALQLFFVYSRSAGALRGSLRVQPSSCLPSESQSSLRCLALWLRYGAAR